MRSHLSQSVAQLVSKWTFAQWRTIFHLFPSAESQTKSMDLQDFLGSAHDSSLLFLFSNDSFSKAHILRCTSRRSRSWNFCESLRFALIEFIRIPLARMGLRHSSRCLLLRRKMAEADSSEVSPRFLQVTHACNPYRTPKHSNVAMKIAWRCVHLIANSICSSICAGGQRICAWCV